MFIKVKSTPSHISSNIFEDHWTNHYGKYNNRNKTIAAKVNEISETVGNQRDNRDQFGEAPPWLISPISMTLVNIKRNKYYVHSQEM